MESSLALVPLFAPVALVAAALLAWRDVSPRPRAALTATRAATLLSLGIAALTAGLAARGAPLVSPLLGASGLGFSVRIDGLSAVMLALVAILGRSSCSSAATTSGETRAKASFSETSR